MAAAASRGGGVPRSSETRKRILRERALLLARPLEEESAVTEEIEVVVFQLGDDVYAIECAHVRESYAISELTPLPCTPAHVLGILNFRGEIVPVVDLRRILGGAEASEPSRQTLVVESECGAVALGIDAISGVQRMPAGLAAGDTGGFVKGFTAEQVGVLDVAALIASTSMGDEIAEEEMLSE